MEKDLIKEIAKISNFSLDETKELDLPETTSWLKEITVKLEEDFDDEDRPNLVEAYLRTHLTFKKVQNSQIGDHLTIRGHIVGSFSTPCVKCLIPTIQEIDTHFSSVFVNSVFKDSEEYADMISIYADGENMDLYFHDKGEINLKELLHEQVLIESEELPLHAPDCKGLCPICGVDRNKEDCGH